MGDVPDRARPPTRLLQHRGGGLPSSSRTRWSWSQVRRAGDETGTSDRGQDRGVVSGPVTGSAEGKESVGDGEEVLGGNLVIL